MSYGTQTAYITGGASGIGKEVANLLVAKGVKLFIADRNYEGAKAVVAALNKPFESSSRKAYAVEVDVVDWNSQRQGFEEAVHEFGRIDFVFPIAGIGEKLWIPHPSSFQGFVEPDLSTMDIDATGVIYTASLAVQQFRQQGIGQFGFKGKIITVASVRGFYPVPSMPMYCAAKFAVVGFVRSYGKHLPKESITLNAICPGILKTNIAAGRSDWYGRAEEEGLVVKMESLLNAVTFLLGASDVSGECLEIPPGNTGNSEGWVVKPNVAFTTPESENHVWFADFRYQHIHNAQSF